MTRDSETAAVRWIHAADQILNGWNHGRAAARDSEQLIIIREMATAGRQIHAADQIPGSWNHGKRLGDSSGHETDPCSGSDTEQLELWPETRRRQL